VVYWCNSYTIVHCSLDIIEWFKYNLKKVFKLYLILIHPPLSINIPKDLPEINNDICVNERIYHIVPTSLYGLGLFSMDGIKVFYDRLTKLMEYIKPYYIYKDWI
jgi:hypothetical protein